MGISNTWLFIELNVVSAAAARIGTNESPLIGHYVDEWGEKEDDDF